MNIPTLRFPNFKNEWTTSKVEDLYKTIPTNSYSRNDLNYTDGSVKNIHYGDIHVKFQSHVNIAEVTLPYINENKNYNRYTDESYCKDGDIILADASEDVKDIGKSIEVLNVGNEKVLSGLHTIHLKPVTQEISLGFGGYIFRNKAFVTQVQKESQGAKVLGISGKKILKLNLSYPKERSEQERITDFVHKVSAKINFLQEKKTLLEQYKKAVMQKIFSQELRFKDENGDEFPNWKRWKLNDLGKTFNGLTGKSGTDFGEGKRYIQYKQIFDNSKINLQHCKHVNIGEDEQQNDVAYGDVFFTTSSETPHEVGMSSVMLDDVQDVYLNSFCFGYRFTSLSDHSPEFYRFYFRSSNLRKKIVKLAQGSTRYNISKSGFLNLSIDVPHIKEQRKIALFLTSLEEKIEVIQDEVQDLKLWQKGLLQQMFV